MLRFVYPSVSSVNLINNIPNITSTQSIELVKYSNAINIFENEEKKWNESWKAYLNLVLAAL